MFAQSEVKWDDPGLSQIWVSFDSDLTQGPIWLRFDSQVTLFESWSGTLTQVQHVLFTISGLSLFDTLTLFDKFDRQRKDKSPFSWLQRVFPVENLIEGRAFV